MAVIERPREPRPRCLRCRKASSMCYCALLPRLDTTTRVVILQHRRERDMSIGTARMASLCLPRAELHVGIDWTDNRPLVRALSDPNRTPVLLYPGPDARDILREPPVGPVTLVVVDGTWGQARTVVRDNPILNALPRYAFAAPEPSRYRIRREPRAEYCSTIEALAHVLGVLEGDPARFRALLVPFDAMIDAQLACEASQPAQRPRRMRLRPKRLNLPATIASRWQDLLCVVGEANAWPYRDGQPTRPTELVHWLAYRPSDGSLFEAIAAPGGELSPSTTFHCELTSAQLAAGMTTGELVDRFAAFVRPTDVACEWGNHASTLFGAHRGVLPQARLDLRVVAQRYTNRKIGGLDAYAGEVTPLAPGRGGRRLAMLAAVLRSWRELLDEHWSTDG
ncbi:MAG: tRNA-uridine aminocarboxypropyltransferase [Kofleriaceae bacterium]